MEGVAWGDVVVVLGGADEGDARVDEEVGEGGAEEVRVGEGVCVEDGDEGGGVGQDGEGVVEVAGFVEVGRVCLWATRVVVDVAMAGAVEGGYGCTEGRRGGVV